MGTIKSRNETARGIEVSETPLFHVLCNRTVIHTFILPVRQVKFSASMSYNDQVTSSTHLLIHTDSHSLFVGLILGSKRSSQREAHVEGQGHVPGRRGAVSGPRYLEGDAPPVAHRETWGPVQGIAAAVGEDHLRKAPQN